MVALAVVNAIAIVVLVAVTIYYALQTRAMAIEMRSTRLLNVAPRLALGIAMPAPTFGQLTVTNVGAGAALDVDVELIFNPAPGVPGDTRRWLEHLVLPLERHVFDPGADVHSMDDFIARYPTATLRGSMSDPLGGEHSVDETIDVAAAWAQKATLQQGWRQDPVEKLEAHAKKLVDHTAKLVTAVETVGRQLGGR